ncbi:MAG: sugar ABC transporter ATP-binding protein [Thermoprotei archaeon]|nr:MAG: sugar ABC transporter ATP-binding protein [Thermoprotei archaeon]HDD63783.1 ABC transporter ATP-binding protein [Thermoprotei archaeon]
MADVKVKNLTKRFGKVIAVNKVSFDVKDKEFVVLLGPSGSGKTTTLRLIAGLERPDEGEIYIGGRLVNNIPPRERDVAMVFQNYALYPHMTVFDNLAFPLQVRKMPKKYIKAKVEEVAKLLKIEDLLDRRPSQLSGGQQQRVALGRALVREPKVFLMDEPLSNLDAKLRVYMRAELKRLQKELGITTIYVTHDQVEAMTMADRIVVFHKGKIQQIGTPSDLYKKPQNIFVAGFIGSPAMNFFDATLTYKDDFIVLDAGEFKLKLPKTFSSILRDKAGLEVVLGIRPEHIKIYKEPRASTVKCRVYVVEPLGGEMIINFSLGGKIYKARYPGEISLKPDETIYIEIPVKHIHIFNKKDGKAII